MTIEEALLASTPSQVDEEDGVEEMASCGSVGAFGYQLPLGMDPHSVNVGASDTRSRQNRKKQNKKEKK